jgi:hypothetical protein
MHLAREKRCSVNFWKKAVRFIEGMIEENKV